MIKNLVVYKVLSILTGLLALSVAVVGVLNAEIYDPVVSSAIMPGVFTQDMLVIMASVVIILLNAVLKQDDYRKVFIIIACAEASQANPNKLTNQH